MRTSKTETPAPAAEAGHGRQESEHVSRRLVGSHSAETHTKQEQKPMGEAIEAIAGFRVQHFLALLIPRVFVGVAIAIIRGAPK
jgi:hypothetical protein